MSDNIEIEKRFFCGLLSHTDEVFPEIQGLLKVEHFNQGSSLHKAMFYVMEKRLEKGLSLDPVIVSTKLKDSGIQFEDGMNVLEYLKNLEHRKVTAKAAIESAKEILMSFCKKEISKNIDKIKTDLKKEKFDTLSDIISHCDDLYNKSIDSIDFQDSDGVVDLFEIMEEVVEGIGENGDNDPIGPHPRMHKTYGSQVIAGNICVIAARSGMGKTTYALDYSTKVAFETNDPVIHFDNGEMSEKELIIRQTAMLSGVPLYYISSGKWRNNKEMMQKVRGAFEKVKGFKFYYQNVGGFESAEMVSALRKTYLSKVGRGNYCVFSFDYIKSPKGNHGHKREDVVIGDMLDGFKTMIQKKILDDNREPCIGMITSVQMNRLGIMSKKVSDHAAADDERSIGLSDKIIQIASHTYLLRRKNLAESARDGEKFGTHYLFCVKPRHMGEEPQRHFDPVEIDGEKFENAICLNINNFDVKECGDLQDVAEYLEECGKVSEYEDPNGDIPI